MPKTKVTFENSMNRLEEIVNELEANDKPLDESIALFEEGLTLVKSCEEKLAQFEDKVNDLIRKDGGEEQDDKN